MVDRVPLDKNAFSELWCTRLNHIEDAMMKKFQEWAFNTDTIEKDTKYGIVKFCVLYTIDAFMIEADPNFKFDKGYVVSIVNEARQVIERYADIYEKMLEVDEEFEINNEEGEIESADVD